MERVGKRHPDRSGRRDAGAALAVVLGLLAVTVVFGTVFPALKRLELLSARRYNAGLRAYGLARGGVHLALAHMQTDDTAYDEADDNWCDADTYHTSTELGQRTIRCWSAAEILAASGDAVSVPDAARARIQELVERKKLRLNVNFCNRDQLAARLSDSAVESIWRHRTGEDGEAGTGDDRTFTSLDDVRRVLGGSETALATIGDKIAVNSAVRLIRSNGSVRKHGRLLGTCRIDAVVRSDRDTWVIEQWIED